jgi:hypothetical protein
MLLDFVHTPTQIPEGITSTSSVSYTFPMNSGCVRGPYLQLHVTTRFNFLVQQNNTVLEEVKNWSCRSTTAGTLLPNKPRIETNSAGDVVTLTQYYTGEFRDWFRPRTVVAVRCERFHVRCRHMVPRRLECFMSACHFVSVIWMVDSD